MTIPETDRWLIDGDCSKCRRKDYCKKECTASKREMEAADHYRGCSKLPSDPDWKTEEK